MNSQVKLERNPEVWCWRVTGEISRAKKRTWEVAVVKLCKEPGSITSEDVSRTLLGGKRQVARRLLGICTTLGLLDDRGGSYYLTEAGRAAAESGLVFVPEHGTWTVWAAHDELLPTPLLLVEPWKEPSAQEETRPNGGKNRPADERQPSPLPHWLLDTSGKMQTPWAGSGDTIRIDKLGEKAESVEPDASVRLTLFLDLQGTRLHLSGDIDKHRVDVRLPEPALTYEAVWTALLRGERLLDSWDEEREALRVSFDATSEEERGSLVRDIVFKAPIIGNAGRFDASTVKGVPIFPMTHEDASDWARWRLLRSTEAYALCERYEAWQVEACSPFEDLGPEVPDRNELLEWLEGLGSEKRPDKKYWYVQAPLDWEL
jgi:hypothetical protein